MNNSDGGIFLFDLFFKEISLFIRKIYIKVIISVMVGMFFGIAISYYSENRAISTGSIRIKSGELIEQSSWDQLKNQLPELINFYLANKEINESELKVYKILSNEGWWAKNADVLHHKNPYTGKNEIVEIRIRSSASDEKTTSMIAIAALNLIKSKGFYLLLEAKFKGMELVDPTSLAKARTENDLSIIYLIEKKKILQKILQGSARNRYENLYLANISSENIKYLPLQTQISAIDIDIFEKFQGNKKIDEANFYNQFIKKINNALQSPPRLNSEEFDINPIENIINECHLEMTVEDKCSKIKYQILELDKVYKNASISGVKTKISIHSIFRDILKYAFAFAILQLFYQLVKVYVVGTIKNDKR